jgi:hypothetical protein
MAAFVAAEILVWELVRPSTKMNYLRFPLTVVIHFGYFVCSHFCDQGN